MSNNKRKEMTMSPRDLEEEHDRKRPRLDSPSIDDSTALVTFVIGKGHKVQTFIMHRDVACHHSPVFRAAFNSQYIEGQTQTYTMDDCDPAAFNQVMHWIYFGRVKTRFDENSPLRVDILDAASREANTSTDPRFRLAREDDERLILTWVLADRLGLEPLQNVLIDAMDAIWEHGDYHFAHLHVLWENTARDSVLRRYFVDQHVHRVMPVLVQDDDDDMEIAFNEDWAPCGFWMRLVITQDHLAMMSRIEEG